MMLRLLQPRSYDTDYFHSIQPPPPKDRIDETTSAVPNDKRQTSLQCGPVQFNG